MAPLRWALIWNALSALAALPCGLALSRISLPSARGLDLSSAPSTSSLVCCRASNHHDDSCISGVYTPLNGTPCPTVQDITAAVGAPSRAKTPLRADAYPSPPSPSSSSASASPSASSRYSPLALPRTKGLRRSPATTVLSATAVSTATAGTTPSNRQSLPRYPTLVLNGDYTPLSLTPLSTWSWQEAVKAVWADKVTMVAAYDEVVRSPSVEIQVPSVIALKMYVQPASPSFCRRNVYLRDRYTCQYCGTKGLKSEMSFDHVTPKCKGGMSTWDNIVTCCRPCNNMKANLSLQQARKSFGMHLQRHPRQPSFHDLQAAAKDLATDNDPRLPHSRRFSYNPAWALYLGLAGCESNEK